MSNIVHTGFLISVDAAKQMYKERKLEDEIKYVKTLEEVPDGWVSKEFKTRVRISRPKPISVLLEDKVWCLFYELGMDTLSSRNFSLKLAESETGQYTKQVDVVAVDSEFIFIIECKSRQELGVHPELNDMISVFAANKSKLHQCLMKIVGRNLAPVFIFATENIEWKENNKLCAKDYKINIFDEYDIMQLRELAKIAGKAAKYQLYNQLFFNKKINSFKVQVPALESKMGGKKYYTFNMIPEHILKIAYVHQRRTPIEYIELTDSYQRILKPSRLKNINKYIEKGGFFPGNIILNFTREPTVDKLSPKLAFEKNVVGDTRPVLLTLPPYYASAWIIDGQHRLYGYANTSKRHTETLPVVAFVSESASCQAQIFVDINKNQKSIETDLLWDLYEDLYVKSDDQKEKHLRAISLLAKSLNDQGPFKNKITIPIEGKKEGVINLKTICLAIQNNRLIADSYSPFFINNYKESVKYAEDRINAYFDIFQSSLKSQWNKGTKGFVCSTPGVGVLFRMLNDLRINLDPKEIKSLERFKNYFSDLMLPLIDHLSKLTEKELKEYSVASVGRTQSSDLQAKFTKIIREGSTGFRSPFLVEWALKHESQKEGVSTISLIKDEDKQTEIKGSLTLDINRMIRGDKRTVLQKDLAMEIVETIAAFLNSEGGNLIVGAIEKSKYPEMKENDKYPKIKDYIIIGIESELRVVKDYDKDKYQLKLRDLISSHLGRSYGALINIDFVKLMGKQICRISVLPLHKNEFCYVDDKRFYRRDGNRTLELFGPDIDKYIKLRLGTL